MNIAGHLTIENWKELEKKLNPDNNIYWDEAYEYFETRISTRYLKPIDSILNLNSNKGEGFAVVNLQCSLIETVECFINGWIHQKIGRNYVWRNNITSETKNRNEDVFISFFREREPFKSMVPEINGSDFFKDVRCGLLHETQTKKGWKIKTNGSNNSVVGKTIYRESFHNDIETVIKNYKTAIINCEKYGEIEGTVLRKNFISKFNHICELSEEN